MRCALIYNPTSGPANPRREEQLGQVLNEFQSLGYRVELIPTLGPGTATVQAREAIQRGLEVVFACGGDGTVHEVLQSVVATGETPGAVFGIIPMGSANALARHLGLSLDPAQALRQQLTGTSASIPVGRVELGGESRFFLVMTGAGPDGALAQHLPRTHKSNLGRFAYYLYAAKLFAFHRFTPFQAELTSTESGTSHTQTAIAALVVRVANLGGLFRGLTSGRASILHTNMEVVLVKQPAWLSLPLWFFFGWLGINCLNPFLRIQQASVLTCQSLSHENPPQVQADGEWLGSIPFTASILPNHLRILLPAHSEP